MTAETQPLSAEDAARLVDFARACKAASRAVTLYPGGHPSIGTTLGRIVQLTSPPLLTEPLRIGVLTNNLLLGGRAPARPDPSVGELAVLLHGHLVGEMIVHAGGDLEAWRNFVKLIARAPDEVRADGGITRLWTTISGRHIELKEIDYADVLRERTGGVALTMERIVDSCLKGTSLLGSEEIQSLIEMVGDTEQLGGLIAALDTTTGSTGQTLEAKTAALIRLFQNIVEAVNKTQPDRLDPVLRNVAGAVGRLSPEMMVSLLSRDREASGTGLAQPGVVEAVVSRMSDQTVAEFVSRNAIAEGSSMERLAQAFQTLVQTGGERERLLALAHDDAAASPLGSTEGFEEIWSQVAQRLLRSYDDQPFISTEYARELSGARSQAPSVDHVSDDPPERVSSWLGTIAMTELRQLDITLLVDLLGLEEDNQRWSELMTPVVALVEDLLLVGDFDAAERMLAVIRQYSGPDASKERRQSGIIAFDMLAAGPMMRHIVTHLASIDDAQFERAKAMCVSFGAVLVRPLAETLAAEERGGTRERLTAILIAFGAAGRRQVERLKSSANAAVRRTAIRLLREFGGQEALPDLTELLDDTEPQVQREALRAILNIGNDAAYRVLEQALTSGSETTRQAIMRSIDPRDERAAPLFAYIVSHVDHRGPLGSVYLRAIESLGGLKSAEGVPALQDALHRGEWWAPRRTAMLRLAAATSLARIGTPDAVDVLDKAENRGARSIRRAVKAARATAPRRAQARKALS
jgi:hypothetical protein